MSDATPTRTIRSLLKRGIDDLRSARIPSYTLAAELLLLHAARRDRTWIYSHPDDSLPEAAAENYFTLLGRRANGEPVQHLTGKQEFWGMEFTVTPEVLIPRPETEHLIEVALDRLAVREVRAGRDPRLSGKNVALADIGTGSGCIAIALAKELPDAEIYATDISAPALAIARQNAARYDLAERIHFLESDLLAGLARPLRAASHPPAAGLEGPVLFELVVSNPPYIGRRESASLATEVRDHEPHQALFGGEEGYELYAALILQSAAHLRPTGILVLELGHNSLPAVQPLLDVGTWHNIGVTNDLAGIPRVLSAERL